MESVNEELIEQYMNLPDKLQRAKRRLKTRESVFYNQTLSSCVVSDGLRVYSRGFSVENNVITYLDKQAATEKYIEILEFKKMHFDLFFNSLPTNTKIALKEKYWNKQPITLDVTAKLCIDEISEIEEACFYRYSGIFNNDFDDNLENLNKEIEQFKEDASHMSKYASIYKKVHGEFSKDILNEFSMFRDRMDELSKKVSSLEIDFDTEAVAREYLKDYDELFSAIDYENKELERGI